MLKTSIQQTKQIEREPFYKELYKKEGLEAITKAGFFHDSNTSSQGINFEESVNIPCTPINFIKFKKNNKGKKCILVSTGAFCPLHQGHIDMMEAAKSKLTQEGWNVGGGYICPDHDEYINIKTKDQSINIHERIMFSNKIIKKHKWLAIDPWAGVFCSYAINFTSIIWRLHLYIKKWLSEDVTIFYICGSDNGRFYKVFEGYENFGIVIVKRPNSPFPKIKSSNFYYTKLENHLSSSIIRNICFHHKKEQKDLIIRIGDCLKEKLIADYVSKYFNQSYIEKVISQQNRWKGNENIASKVVNLDEESEIGIPLHISRHYDLFGQKKLGYISRPGTKSIEIQISQIQQKSVYLFDDDIQTGETMKYIEKELSKRGINVQGRLSYIMSTEQNNEILDAKDFILGSHGGLVISLKNTIFRVPYILPFVSPKERASINSPLSFSIHIWETNKSFFNSNDYLKDFPHLSWLILFGFTQESSLQKICDHYINLLKKLLPRN